MSTTDKTRSPAGRRRRRWTVLAIVLAAIALALVVVHWRQTAVRKHIEAIEQFGGIVEFESALPDWVWKLWPGGGGFAQPGSWEERLLAFLARFERVVAVRLGGNSRSGAVRDEHLAHVGAFRSLKVLDLAGTHVTDAGLTRLTGLTRLERLSLEGNVVTDDGLAHLTRLRKLRVLELSSTRITDAGLVHLRGLQELEELYLFDTEVGDEGLVHVGSLRNLGWLDLADTKVSDAGLVHLYGLEELESIVVGNASVTAEGIDRLRRALPRLEPRYSVPLN